MNRKAVASELVKVARLLAADELPEEERRKIGEGARLADEFRRISDQSELASRMYIEAQSKFYKRPSKNNKAAVDAAAAKDKALLEKFWEAQKALDDFEKATGMSAIEAWEKANGRRWPYYRM